MKKILIMKLLLLSLIWLSCETTVLVELPEEVALGETEVYMNGEAVNYRANIYYFDSIGYLSFVFTEIKDNGLTINTMGFGFLPTDIGRYILHTEYYTYVDGKFIFPTGALTSFNQAVEEDLPGYEYKLIDEEEGFFEITTLDLVNRTVSGRFKASFKRTSKRGVKGQDLPKKMVWQGVFNEHF